MMQQTCPGHRPGFAKRHDGFERLKAASDGVSLPDLTRIAIDRAALMTTRELSPAERILLLYYVSHLSMDDIARGRSSVFPGSARTTRHLGVSAPTLRRQRAALEKAGYIIRRYDRRNRPLDSAGIDLRPFLASIPARLQRLSQEDAADVQHRNEQRMADGASSASAQALISEPLNRSKNLPVNSTDDFRVGGPVPRGEGRTQAPQAADSEHLALAEHALRHAPKLRKALGGMSLEGEGTYEAVQVALPDLFPGEKPASIHHTGRWAFHRLGLLAFVALAAALEDPNVRRPAAYFGRLVTRPERFVPEDTLKRLEKLNPQPVVLPVFGDHAADQFVRAFAERAGEGAPASYLGPDTTRLKMQRREIVIVVSGATAFKRLSTRYRSELEDAAASVGASGVSVLRNSCDPNIRSHSARCDSSREHRCAIP